MAEMLLPGQEELPPIKVLSKSQRRVLGALIEKGITTPEYYPLTLKAVVTACNQKNNRSPLSEYSEDDAERAINQLRELGLAAVVHTESGRSERYRHYARKRFPFNESQLAIMTELWLRGRQSMGDLRVRASRLHAIDSLEDLRREVKELQAQGYVQANGPLEARGVEVDHCFYKPEENKTLNVNEFSTAASDVSDADGSGVFRKNTQVGTAPFLDPSRSTGSASASSTSSDQVRQLQMTVNRLEVSNSDLNSKLTTMQQSLAELTDRFEALRRELGAS